MNIRSFNVRLKNNNNWAHLSKCIAIVFIYFLSPFSVSANHQYSNDGYIIHAEGVYESLSSDHLLSWIDSLKKPESLDSIRIVEPLLDTIFPKDMAGPAFIWEDAASSTTWLITLKKDREVYAKIVVSKPWWIPESAIWKEVLKRANHQPVAITIEGIGGWTGRDIISKAQTTFSISKYPVDANLMFMRKPLPFLTAKNHPEQTSLLLGKINSYESPSEIMKDIPICSNCHSYSLNGKKIAIDMDYGGDKGAFLFSKIGEELIDKKVINTWNTLQTKGPAKYSMGLFSQVSPGGRYLAGTVNETSVFVMMEDLYFSQLFYPATGQIAIFDSKKGSFDLLPGASSSGRVQTNPSWSPDGKTIAFSIVKTDSELIQKSVNKEILKENNQQKIGDLNKKYPVQFNIYTVPFNRGKGGESKPLEGASHNGYSNYFPRYSPDGKWIVFTQSPTGLVLQPDSKLVIIPSGGGEARVLRSNQPVMNSWHSWSPNSKWLVFTCKANSPYTELYLTHINKDGDSSPAIRLYRFSSTDRAAMVPEFLSSHANLPEAMFFIDKDTAKGKSIATDGR